MSDTSAPCLFITPSLKVTGGNLEIIRLAREVAAAGVAVGLVTMWRTAHESDAMDLPVTYLSQSTIGPRTVVLEFPTVAWRFRRLIADRRPRTAVFTHYVTFPLSWIIHQPRRWFFVQDTEWLFVHGHAKSAALKRLILGSLRRGNVLSANRYLTRQFAGYGINIVAEAPIWADERYMSDPQNHRDVDIAMMLRRGAHKRADLTLAFMQEVQARFPAARLVAISPDDSYRSAVPASVQYIERPSLLAMRSLYERTKLFALMSEHEGFGLPPLEAMGAGCVPICRDAGGVRSYMLGDLAANVLPLDRPTSEVADHAVSLLSDQPRWAYLSNIARDVFHQGQVASAGRAAALLAAGF